MVIAVTYHVDTDLYFASAAGHAVALSTTEYTYKSDILVHLRAGNKTAVHVNHLLRNEFKTGGQYQGEQFFAKKIYGADDAKPIARSAFNEKLRSFDMGRTVIEREILEEYAYTDEKGNHDTVRIELRGKGLEMTAVIEFKDTGQHRNFVCPAWLTARSGEN